MRTFHASGQGSSARNTVLCLSEHFFHRYARLSLSGQSRQMRLWCVNGAELHCAFRVMLEDFSNNFNSGVTSPQMAGVGVETGSNKWEELLSGVSNIPRNAPNQPF